jgi:MFS family permease
MNRVINRELVSVIAIVSLAVMAMSVLQPVLPLYLTSIGVNPTVLGLMFSVGMVGMVFGESSAGWLADKIGVKIPLGIGTIACIPLVLCFVFTRNVPFIFAIFLVWGVVRAAVFGPGRGYIGVTVPFSRKATFMAVYAASMSVSGSIGSLLGGFVGDRLGYDWNFYFAAGIGLLGGALVIFALRKIPSGKPALPLPATPSEIKTTIKAPYRSRAFLSQCVIATLCWASLGVISPFLPLLAVDVTRATTTDVGILFTASALVRAALLIPIGRLSDRTNKKGMMIAGLLVTAAGMAGIALAKNYPGLIAAVIIESVGSAIFGPAAVALLSETVPSNWQNTAMGIYGGCEDIGVVAGSALGGLVWSSLGPTSAFLLVGTATPIIGAIVTFTLLRNKTIKAAVS